MLDKSLRINLFNLCFQYYSKIVRVLFLAWVSCDTEFFYKKRNSMFSEIVATSIYPALSVI